MEFVVRHIRTASVLDLFEGKIVEYLPGLCVFILRRHIVVRHIPVMATVGDLGAALALSALE